MTDKACCGNSDEARPASAENSACCGAPGPTAQQTPQSSCCGAPRVPPADYPYGAAPYVVGAVKTPVGPVPRITPNLERADRLGAWRVRWGVARGDYRVRPGLYALGAPDATAPVLVTANYKLTFDALRGSLGGLNAWLLVVDTRGINVWCAAGKGTFSAEEVARMVHETRLVEVVEHRRLILPQLSAPGVAAHQVKQACGFRVIFGPVRAADLPPFLAADLKADAAMRTVTFDLKERLVLAPVEIAALRDRRMLAAYAAVIAASSIDRDGISLARGLRRGLPVVGAAGLAVLAGGGLHTGTAAVAAWACLLAQGRHGRSCGRLGRGSCVPQESVACRQARAACRCADCRLLCSHDLHRLDTDHLALRRRGRDATRDTPAGRRRRACGGRLARNPVGEVSAVSGLRYIEHAVTLQLDAELCNGCGSCLAVCPRAVFEMNAGRARLADRGACIECGACALNCERDAIRLKPGVGCAVAIIHGWLTGGEPSCDCG